jgi:hypothetical protein
MGLSQTDIETALFDYGGLFYTIKLCKISHAPLGISKKTKNIDSFLRILFVPLMDKYSKMKPDGSSLKDHDFLGDTDSSA